MAQAPSGSTLMCLIPRGLTEFCILPETSVGVRSLSALDQIGKHGTSAS